jgi:hypothetical protein
VRVVSTAQIGQPMEGIGVDEVWQAVRSLAAELGLP